ncbi:MAG: hypothetical protein ACXWVJ_08930 [Caulobacteraceae bacterium]
MLMLPGGARDRPRKCVLLLSSDQPGEVVAAAATIGRTLTAHGSDWHAPADALIPPTLKGDPVEELLADLAAQASHPGDRTWLERLSRHYRWYGRLSERQLQVLADIAARHGRR